MRALPVLFQCVRNETSRAVAADGPPSTLTKEMNQWTNQQKQDAAISCAN